MLHQTVLMVVLAAVSVSAVPLNINLGAYSPALVVGDGEISFAGTDGAGNLIEELESGAVSAGQQNGEAAPSGANIVSPSEQAQASVASVASLAAAATETTESTTLPTSISPESATSTSSSTTSTAEEAASTGGTPARAIKEGIDPSTPRPNLARRETVRGSSANRPRSSLQLTESQRATFKRDITGFREALNYAIQAQKNTPKIELGTENAGVGILVNPGLNVPQGSAAAGTPEQKGAKRSLDGFEGAVGEKAGITLLAIAEI